MTTSEHCGADECATPELPIMDPEPDRMNAALRRYLRTEALNNAAPIEQAA